MPRNRSPRCRPAELGELELSILLIVWRKGALTPGQVGEELGRPFDGPAIRFALRLLEENGCLAHSVQGQEFLYRPAGTRGRRTKRLQICVQDGEAAGGTVYRS